MSDNVYTALFLHTGNSTRSIMEECALNRHGQDKFKACSASSQPEGEVHAAALQLLRKFNYLTDAMQTRHDLSLR